MSKSINFFGQPIYGQLIKSLDREKIVEMSRAFRGRFCDPPETLPHTPRWFPGLPEMSRAFRGRFCDPPKPCRKLRAGLRDSRK